MSLLSLLGLIFIVLKLVGVITWSWWLVLAPFYGVFVVVLVLYAVIGATFLSFFIKH